jgi:deoxyribonuclease V
MAEKKEEDKSLEIAKRFNIDLDVLKEEQTKLAKDIILKDKIDFSLADRFGAVENIFINNKLLSCFIICNKDYEVIDRAYSYERVKFPYISGFRGYREIVPMIIAYEKLKERPDVVFIPGNGITHPRLGLGRHFSISVGGVPTIGVANNLMDSEIKGEDIIKKGKKVGRVLVTKEGSNPMYVSPGNNITLESSYDLCKKMINLPHKKPEPMHLARKYAKEVQKEVSGK